MEQCALYFHEPDFDRLISTLRKVLPQAAIGETPVEEGISLKVTLKGGFLKKNKVLTLTYRERNHPSYQLNGIEDGITQNLMGMSNFIMQIPAQNAEIQQLLAQKIETINAETGWMAEPSLSPEFQEALFQVAKEFDGFIFSNPTPTFPNHQGAGFLDPEGRLILDQSGTSSVDTVSVKINSAYFDQPSHQFSEEQAARKQKNEASLEAHGITVNKGLPAVDNEDTVEIRSLEEVCDRIMALLLVAAYGEGLERERVLQIADDKGIESFTPWEEEILQQEEPLNNQQKANATWRYESLSTLLWAIGHQEELPYPDNICDVPTMVQSLLPETSASLQEKRRLLPTNTLLDKLDLVYRMHWACVNARIKGEVPGGGLNPSIVYERHYALNWLTCYGNDEWDDVATDT